VSPGRGRSWANLAAALAAAAFPPGCPACGRPPAPGGEFCPECAAELAPAPPGCPVCGGGPPEPAACPACRARPPAFRRARALLAYQGPAAAALKSFKYRRRLAAGQALARHAAASAPQAWLAGAQVLAPVPLHPWRLVKRGFNQALALFAPLARSRGLELAPRLLRRRRHTRPQVGLSLQQRRDNVAGAFAPDRAREAEGKVVVLVDDVFTTGATAGECARVLAAAGAAEVRVLTLVRAGAAGGPDPDAPGPLFPAGRAVAGPAGGG
jgi:ComF family protein